MKLKTNKLLTLTLATGLVAMTAGCGGSKTPTASGGNTGGGGGGGTADTVAYSDWSGSVTIADDVTDNAFLAGTAAVAAVGSGTATAANLTGLPNDEDAMILTLASEVTPDDFTPAGAAKAINAVNLGGAATNAVGFATSGATTEARFVAGVIAGTDLGAPLTATTVTGDWAGLFQAIGVDAVRKAFTLTVTFSATGDDTISGLIPVDATAFAAGAMSYYISGTYNAAGVITGSVLYRDFSVTATDDTTARGVAVTALEAATATGAASPATDGLGVLSGLIGANGAVGAFYSNAEGATAGFSGGFVASKADNIGGDDPDVVYADWAAGATQAADTTGNNAFLASNAAGDALTGTPASGVTVQTLNLRSQVATAIAVEAGTPANVEGVDAVSAVTLGGQATDSVAFFTNPGATPATDAQFFAGLHSTTDLGDPIAAAGDITGAWAGLFQAIGSGDYATAAKPITLTVTFDANGDDTIIGLVGANNNADAFTAAGTSYYISGTYNADGVIAGSVLYRDFSAATDDATARTAAGLALTAALADGAASPATDGLGVLSGLIGQDGVVGAFYSNANGAAGYAGGFVASRTANAGGVAGTAATHYVVNHAAWDVTPIAALTANGFLTSSGTDVLTFADLQTPVTQVKVDLSAGAGGVTYFETVDGASAFYKAGIHADTTLGEPVTATTVTGTWSGVFGAVGNAEHDTPNTTAITLTVAFGDTDAARTIIGLVPANDNANAYGVNGETSYYISGRYNTAGVISGNVLYGDFATGNVDRPAALVDAASDLTAATASTATGAATNGVGTLTGLIGQLGAVGAFYSSGNDGNGAEGYAGGFAVTRTAPSP